MSDHELDVVVIGAIGIDTNVFVPDRAPDGADALFVSAVDLVGQAGGYSVRGFAALGRRTAFVGHVGTDPWGQLVRMTLADAGVDTTAVFDDPAGTARSVNLVESEGRRRAFYDGRGAGIFVPDLDAAGLRCSPRSAGGRPPPELDAPAVTSRPCRGEHGRR